MLKTIKSIFCSADPSDDQWAKPFATLRDKWVEVPTTASAREKTTNLLNLSDEELLKTWHQSREDITTGDQWTHRGWYHELYGDFMNGKRVLDVGSGLAVDSITFAEKGAHMTFLDLAQSNLDLVARLCRLMGLDRAEFCLLEDLHSLEQLKDEYDVIMAMGSLHHAPREVIIPEVRELLKHLRVGGRWLQLAYPSVSLFCGWDLSGLSAYNNARYNAS